jgi:NADP-dependent 3-hydroxy acid dehydrogenase YdfG
MTEQQVTVPLPENLYLRLKHVAQATQQSFTDVLIHAVEMGSPPSWETAPSEFQEDLAPLDRLNDEALWQIARSHKTEADMERYQELLDKNADGTLTEGERVELVQMRTEADRFMLRKAHAAALLRWRGHKLPPPEKM